MKTQIQDVTPKQAREWLKLNTSNRPLRPSHVETLRASFERGEYVMTHQGIAFSDEGVLIDGQHRLTAISLLPESFSFQMLVTRGLDRDTAFPVVDAVQAKRSTSDVLGLDVGMGYLANFMAKLHANRNSSVTPVYAEPFARWADKEYRDLCEFCAGTCKTWSSAPVRAAAIIAMKVGHDADYVKLVYSSLVRADFSVMPPAIQALYRSHINGKVRAAAANDIFCRALKVFDPKNAKLTKIQINDPSAVVASVRDMMDQQIFGGKKKAPAIASARKCVSSSNYQLAGL
jgi:hypothetical protein